MKIITKKIQHKQLAAGRWYELTFCEQMANVGSEIERAIAWKNINKKYSDLAVNRALELLSLTIDDKKNINRLKELTRDYESLADYFYGDNIFESSDILWKNYFYHFAYAARINLK